MDTEAQDMRRRLAGILDVATRHRLSTRNVRSILRGEFLRTVENSALSDALRALYKEIEDFGLGGAEGIFESEIRKWEERRGFEHEVEENAHEHTKFVFPFAAIRQEAVGHGGFHTGVLGFNKPTFRWAYDCGSWRKRETLALRIEEFLRRARRSGGQRDLDILFVSHFDADHVNGLERLFAGIDGVPTKVRMVVAPYLGPMNSLAVIARELQIGKGGAKFVQAVSDPSGYFGEKGVETLVLVKPDQPPPDLPEGHLTSPAPTLPPAPPSPSKDDRIGVEFIGPDGKAQDIGPFDLNGEMRIVHADPGSFFEVSAPGRWLNWVFVPHAYQWDSNTKHIADQATKLFGMDPAMPGFEEALIGRLRTQEGLRRVKQLYVGLNSNSTSMSVYVGPRSDWVERSVYAEPTRPPGWLLTGDAPLNKRDAFAAWKYSFASFASSVGRMMLPHHGAKRNFNVELARVTPKASIFLTVDRDDFVREKRPPKEVRETLGSNLRAVTERKNILDVSGEHRHAYMVPEVSSW